MSEISKELDKIQEGFRTLKFVMEYLEERIELLERAHQNLLEACDREALESYVVEPMEGD